MTTKDAAVDVKKLNLGLRLKESLEVTCGGHRCTLTLKSYHGGYADLEIDAPLDFTFVRETAKAKHLKAGKGAAR